MVIAPMVIPEAYTRWFPGNAPASDMDGINFLVSLKTNDTIVYITEIDETKMLDIISLPNKYI